MRAMRLVRSGHILNIFLMVESTGFSDGIDVCVREREESRMNLRYLSEQWYNLFRKRKLGGTSFLL